MRGRFPALAAGNLDLIPASGNRDRSSGSTLLVSGWEEDTYNNGKFEVPETGIGTGLGANGVFQLRAGSTIYPSTGFSYQSGHCYRLNASWSAPEISGARQVSLSVRDLTSDSDLNGGSPVATASSPGQRQALGLCVNRGLVDSLGVEGPGCAGWMENRVLSLAGGTDGDDDGDGIAHAFEYALGLDPTQADPAGRAPSPVLGSNTLTLFIPEIALAEDVLVEVDYSSDQDTWDPAIGQQTADSIDYHQRVPNVPEKPHHGFRIVSGLTGTTAVIVYPSMNGPTNLCPPEPRSDTRHPPRGSIEAYAGKHESLGF